MYEDKNAIYALNSYLWKLLTTNLGWTSADYSGSRPIIPSSQQPEFLATGKTFIVYGSADLPPGHLYDLNSESVAYNIYSPSATEANKVANLIRDTFKRQDDAASDVNDWLDIEGAPGNRTSGHRGISFASIRMTMVEKAEPADEEGGFVAALVMAEIKYVVHNDSIQTSGFTYP